MGIEVRRGLHLFASLLCLACLLLLALEWISTDDMDLVKLFLLAERTGNWLIHLQTVHGMLGLFAATGHVNYAKSARLYLQEMVNLPETHRYLHEQFMNG